MIMDNAVDLLVKILDELKDINGKLDKLDSISSDIERIQDDMTSIELNIGHISSDVTGIDLSIDNIIKNNK